MHVWMIRDMEPIPGDSGNPRLLRGGMLVNALVEKGHEVRWITSTFNHYARAHRAGRDESRRISGNLTIEVLSAPGYSKNSTMRRVWHNHRFARAYMGFAERATRRPDVIVADIPTTESAYAAVRTAQRWAIPSVVSVRDLWPDVFREFAPSAMRPFLTVPLMHFERQVSYACRHANAIVGISERYLDWGLNKAGRGRRSFDAIVPLGYKRPSVDAAEECAARERLSTFGVDFEKDLVVFAGSWGATCDLELVLRVARRLRTRPDIQFVLAGEGSKRAPLAREIAGLPNVVAPGWLDASEVTALLRASKLGLMPYRAGAPQGLPNKIFEYMAHGVFQISTLQGEAAQLLSSFGIGNSTPPGDVQSMVAAIVDALGEHACEARRREIRDVFVSRYDADVVYEAFVDHVERLVKANGS